MPVPDPVPVPVPDPVPVPVPDPVPVLVPDPVPVPVPDPVPVRFLIWCRSGHSTSSASSTLDDLRRGWVTGQGDSLDNRSRQYIF